jgi:hypothetical protein
MPYRLAVWALIRPRLIPPSEGETETREREAPTGRLFVEDVIPTRTEDGSGEEGEKEN